MATPPRSSTVADAPRTELGAQIKVPAFSFVAPVIDDRETARDLRWPQNVKKTYPAMLNDAQAGGLYRGATLPIRAYRWWLHPNGARPEAVDRISRNYNLPVGPTGEFNRRRGQRRFNFDQHLEDALRAIVLSHAYFEQVVDARQDGPADVNAGWVAHLRKLAYRPAHTITKITPARDGGLESITVPALREGRDVLNLQGTEDLSVDRIVAYVWDREGANWRGRSMFRDCYRPWKLKDTILKVGAINIERAGGVPYIEAPEGADPKLMAELHVLATMFRVGQEAGAALPHGATLKFASAAGGAEAINFVRLQNEEMARAWLMMWMTAGQTSSGHGSTEQTGQLLDNFSHVQHAIANWFRGVFNEHVIEDDVEWNEGPGEEFAPLLMCTPQSDPLGPTADALDDAQVAGALPADSAVAAAVKGETTGGRRRPTRPAASSAAGTDDRLPARELHRDRFPHEVTAATDFAALETTHQDAVSELVEAWQEIRAEQIDDLVSQAEQAGDLNALTQLSATVRGAELLRDVLGRVATEAVAQAMDEAAEQGAALDPPDMDAIIADVEARADATASLMAQALSDAARRRAVALAGDHATPETVAAGVREHLDSLSDAFLEEQFTGAVTEAQNGGRRAVFDVAEEQDTAVRIYASALLDASTCTPCAEDDGKEYASTAAFAVDFPTGGNRRCKGGRRCRCTGVAVYAEAAPSVQ